LTALGVVDALSGLIISWSSSNWKLLAERFLATFLTSFINKSTISALRAFLFVYLLETYYFEKFLFFPTLSSMSSALMSSKFSSLNSIPCSSLAPYSLSSAGSDTFYELFCSSDSILSTPFRSLFLGSG
jgi:hypothetical protein